MKKKVLLLGATLSFLFVCCSKDKEVSNLITLSSFGGALYPGDAYQIEAASNKPIHYSSEDEYHASVSQTGLVIAKYVGETNIVLSNGSDTKKVAISVKAKMNLYPEPNLEFGTLKSDLIAKYGNPSYDDETHIHYSNFSAASPSIVYYFDGNNKLKMTVVVVKKSYCSEIGTFLTERYMPINTEKRLYMNALKPEDATLFIVGEIDTGDPSYWFVYYQPYHH